MFTIKNVVRPNGPGTHGEDDVIRLWEGRNVSFEMNATTKEPFVGFTMPDEVYATIDTGMVYVMNAAGKTVDTYRLKGADWL